MLYEKFQMEYENMQKIVVKRNLIIVCCVISVFMAVDVFAKDCGSGSGRSRFLLLDSRIIDSVVNAELVVGTVEKHKANPLFTEDKPWEKRFDNLYGNVIYDKEENIYKCWYSCTSSAKMRQKAL
jgi:hypothetical protein